MKSKKILFVTTSNLATNPRLVKEVALALSLQMEVTVVAFRFQNWSHALNEDIKKRWGTAVHCIEISGDRNPFGDWLYSTIGQYLCSFALRCGLATTFMLSQALQKRTVLLQKTLKKLNGASFDIAIAHNPGAFYPTAQWAKKNKVALGIDVEDYHPGEYTEATMAAKYVQLMKATLPQATYISYAALPIGEQVIRDTNYKGRSFEIVNAFPSDEFLPSKPPLQNNSNKIQLVWFSQHIGKGRGLDDLLAHWKQMDTAHLQLHLIGAITPDYKAMIDQLPNIDLHEPMTQPKLHQFLLQCDVGLAIEDNKANYNRELCITNKIIAYYQAGLATIATNTIGQQSFFDRYSPKGVLIKPEQLMEVILQLKQGEGILSKHNTAPNNLCWEKEQKKLQTVWEQIVL